MFLGEKGVFPFLYSRIPQDTAIALIAKEAKKSLFEEVLLS